MTFSEGTPPLNLSTTSVTPTAADCQMGFRVTLPAILRWLQEAAGLHAEQLGVGIRALQDQGLTWMLSRICLRIHRTPTWGETLTLLTWPSGIRGRLVAERQFVLQDASGHSLVEASSEWLCVNTTIGKLAPLPETVKALAAPHTAAFGLCSGKFPTPDAAQPPSNTVHITARKAEVDANHHINNVHLAAWAREPLPDERFFDQTPNRFDIEYKHAAQAGDCVTALLWSQPDNGYLHHVLSNDGTLLVRACSIYSTP